MYYIKILHSNNRIGFIAEWDGDPGRTLVFENAKSFSTKKEAEKKLNKLQKLYPNRAFEIVKR